jgi:DNA-damage-inducible protein D
MASNVFEQIKKIDENGREYWSARDLTSILEYSEYRHLLPVIEKAKESCKNSGEVIHNHFEDVLEMVKIGSGAERPIENVYLDRYACYLIIQNSDPTKEVVALGQTYFAIQTRRQEKADQMIEDSNRLHLRNEIKKHNVSLAEAAENAGVENYGRFQNYGYKGLYGGLDMKDIHSRKGLKKSQKILDYMGSEELAANLFRATQADAKLRRERIQGEDLASLAHYHVGRTVRKTIEELGGTMPEELPGADGISKAKRRIEKADKKKVEIEDKSAGNEGSAIFSTDGLKRRLIVTLPFHATPEMVHRLSELFNSCSKGLIRVFLQHQKNRLETPFSVAESPTLLEDIKKAIKG